MGRRGVRVALAMSVLAAAVGAVAAPQASHAQNEVYGTLLVHVTVTDGTQPPYLTYVLQPKWKNVGGQFGSSGPDRGELRLGGEQGVYDLTIDAIGYAPLTVEVVLTDWVELHLQLERLAPVVVTGRLVNESGAAVAGRTFSQLSSVSWPWSYMPWQDTAPDGTFRIELPGESSWNVFITADGFDEVIIPIGERPAGTLVDLGPQRVLPHARIVGTVRDSSGRPLGGVSVGVPRSGTGMSTTTAGDGTYRLDTDTFESSGMLSVTKDGYAIDCGPLATRPYLCPPNYFPLTAGSVTQIDVTMGELASISGRAISAGGWPMRGVNVHIEANGQSSRSATTDSDGRYTITGVGPGAHLVHANGVRSPGDTSGLFKLFAGEYYEDAYIRERATPVVVTSGTPRTGIDFQLQRPANLEVRVRDASGSPYEYTYVMTCAPPAVAVSYHLCDDRTETMNASFSGNGVANFYPQIPPGAYEISIMEPDGQLSSFPLTIAGGDTIVCTVQVGAGAVLGAPACTRESTPEPPAPEPPPPPAVLVCPDAARFLVNTPNAHLDVKVMRGNVVTETRRVPISTTFIGQQFVHATYDGVASSKLCFFDVVYDVRWVMPSNTTSLWVARKNRSSEIALRLSDASGAPLDHPFAPTVTTAAAPCPQGKKKNLPEYVYSPVFSVGGVLRIGWYAEKTFNGTCRAITIQLADGSRHTTIVKVA